MSIIDNSGNMEIDDRSSIAFSVEDNEVEEVNSEGEREETTTTTTITATRTKTRNTAIKTTTSRVSCRFDTCIVYALDECLTRGSYHIFARWLYCHLAEEDLPGSLIVVGFESLRRRYAANNTTEERCSQRDRERSVNLGGNVPVPYIRLDPNDQYAIFDFKRQTGYPAIVLLVTLPSSRMETCLSCDGTILIHARHTLRRNITEVAEILCQLNNSYLNDLYTCVNVVSQSNRAISPMDTTVNADDNTDESCDVSRVIGFEQRRDTDNGPFDNGLNENGNESIYGGATITAANRLVTNVTLLRLDDARELLEMSRPILRMQYRHSDESSDDDEDFRSTSMRNNGEDDTSIVRLYGQNRNLLDRLQNMDASLTTTHPFDRLPVVHGESVDAFIPLH